MKNATKRELKKQDQFITFTERGFDWVAENRQTSAVAGAIIVVLILIAVGGWAFYQHRSANAATAFGQGMQIYQTPLATPGQPLVPGTKTYPSAADRAKAANAVFTQVAHQYGLTGPGHLAEYFAGVTYMEEGQNASAESTLKKVAGFWDRDLAATGKLALAQLYQQTGRDNQAADLYAQLTKTNAATVPSGMAQIELAEMYASEGQTQKARDIYAKVKDQDKNAKGVPGAAGSLAAEKLNPAPTAGGLPPAQSSGTSE